MIKPVLMKIITAGIGIILLMSTTGILAQEIVKADHSGTKICFVADKKIFPRSWRNDKTAPHARAIKQEAWPHLISIINIALNKYPEKVTRKNLKKVYILRTMMFFGLDFGGTYHKKKVYLTSNGIKHGYTDQYIKGTFHHEFSSVLLKRHRKYFDEDAWHAINPPDFSYGEGGVAALKASSTNLEFDTCLYQSGFLNEYSLASMEEDFNCYAQFLFLSTPEFWEAWETSEAVKRKTALLIAFYHRLDSVFTLEYFRSFEF